MGNPVCSGTGSHEDAGEEDSAEEGDGVCPALLRHCRGLEDVGLVGISITAVGAQRRSERSAVIPGAGVLQGLQASGGQASS